MYPFLGSHWKLLGIKQERGHGIEKNEFQPRKEMKGITRNMMKGDPRVMSVE